MPRHGNRSFCCSAGCARVWMEEKLGTRINANHMDEALATGAEQVAVACPFSRVTLGDSLTSKQADGSAGEGVEVSSASPRCCWPPSAGVTWQANRRASEDFLVLVVDPGPGCVSGG